MCCPCLCRSGDSARLNNHNPTISFTTLGGGTFRLSIGGKTQGGASDDFLNQSGFYSLVQSAGSITGAPTAGCTSASCTFNITQTPSTNVAFYYGANTPNGKDAGYLAGNLQLVDLTQTPCTVPHCTTTGTFNDSVLINLTNISTVCAAAGGACDLVPGFFPGNGILQLTIHFSTNLNLYTASALKKTSAYISTGSVVPVVAEPASLLILGVGLIGFAGLGRRKLLAS